MKLGFSADLAAAQLERLLVEDAYILTRAGERTAQGGTNFTYVKGDEPVPCAFQPRSGGEYLGRGGRAQKVAPGERIEERREDLMLVAAGTVITQHDRLEVVGGETYEVVLVPQRSTELLLELDVREVAD